MTSIKDLTIAFGLLQSVKGYSLTIILTLGVTLGALVTMFNLNYQLLAKPLPYEDQERLYLVKGDAFQDGQLDLPNMYPYPTAINIYKNNNDVFEEKALVNFSVDIIRNLVEIPQVRTAYVTPEYHQLLQTPMALGRNIESNEGLDNKVPVAVISYATWRRLFGLDKDVLGKVLRFGEVDFKIVGVTSENFFEPQFMGPGQTTEVWLPWDYNLVEENWKNGWGVFVEHQYVVGKLKKDIQPKQVEQALSVTLNAEYVERMAGRPSFLGSTIAFQLISYEQAILGDSKGRVLLLLAGAFVLLLIACVNIINLILSRAANQQRSMAIRAALGAKKTHLFSAVFAEILVLMVIATVLALIVAFGGIQLLKQYAGDQLPRISELKLDWQSFIAAVTCAFCLAFLFAIFISHQINYRKLNGILQSSGKGSGIQISPKVRQLLILTQVTLTSVLLAASLQILHQSLINIRQPIGLTTKDIYHVQVNMGSQRYKSPEERKNDLIAISKQLSTHPSVDKVSLTNDFPMSTGINPLRSYLSENPGFLQQKQALLYMVDENYLDIFDLELVAGRKFRADEFQNDATVVIINETFADSLIGGGEVLGKRFYWFNSYKRHLPYEVIGIVKDHSLPGVTEETRMFFPQAYIEKPQLLIKVKANHQFSNVQLNEIMGKVNGQYKASELLSMSNNYNLLLANYKLSAGLTAGLVILAISLAGIGIYGVLSYSVRLRRYELGIRLAIGAKPIKILMLIIKDNLTPVVIGIALALIMIAGFISWLDVSSYSVQTSVIGWVAPALIICVLAVAVSALSVWPIIGKPVIGSLQSDR